MSEPTRIYTEEEMTILRAASNLLKDAHTRTVEAVHGEKATGREWQWIVWAGRADAAADALGSVVFRHDRWTEDIPEPQSVRAES